MEIWNFGEISGLAIALPGGKSIALHTETGVRVIDLATGSATTLPGAGVLDVGYGEDGHVLVVGTSAGDPRS